MGGIHKGILSIDEIFMLFNYRTLHPLGNRMTGVLEDAVAVTQNGGMDYPGGKKELAFEYNDWGGFIKDESLGIADISYDRFGNPLRVSFSGGGYTENTYSATGEKLKTILGVPVTSTGSSLTAMGRTVMTYRGNVVYRNGIVDMVLFPGGYATVSGCTVTFHYYTQDYLGNNRAVINGSTGAIEQLTAYYPYGGIIADLGTVATAGQPYRFGGKELITANGLNEYDFGARQYYSAVPGFTKPDPMCEKYYWLSPYLYCMNNPVNAIDPDGRDVYLYATTLPGGPDFGNFINKYGPTHTFITVVQGDKISYFAYGSEIDGPNGAVQGHLARRFYSQDREVYTSDGGNKNLKVKIKIAPPEGMNSDEFDKAVIDTANSYGDKEGINYHFASLSDITGNCNSSSSTSLFKSGVSKERLSEIKDIIPGMDWGFGDIKPWTESEQTEALKKAMESLTRMLYYEKLEESLH